MFLQIILPINHNLLPLELALITGAPTVKCLKEKKSKPYFKFLLSRAVDFQNNLACTDDEGKFDKLIEDKGGKILIDPKALMHVIGTEMDFVDHKLRSEFIFVNPNATGQCGCGESFMTTTSSEAAKFVANLADSLLYTHITYVSRYIYT
ncbi:hypothetical protein MTR67_047032 [Solanum verrucosum]|uniref:Core domain-containing protein n=1 Tax=Solanum verrucosum TaxID=315347 RepID=A0AAF0UVW3_SOLVR|nr:hypothetical protein MTR67_047032 [Solanum verrucosum]